MNHRPHHCPAVRVFSFCISSPPFGKRTISQKAGNSYRKERNICRKTTIPNNADIIRNNIVDVRSGSAQQRDFFRLQQGDPLSQLEHVIPRSLAAEIQEALYKMDVEALQRGLEKYLMQTISFYDAANESYYHGMIVGLCAMMINSFRITSNRESGNGRYDVQMLPLTKHFPGFLIEIKAEKDCSEEQLEALAQTALQQINDRSYSAEMQALGIKSIIKYGLAFSGKSARIAAEKQTIE